MYRPIDQVETGRKLKQMIESAGYDVKDIQKYLYLSCPQSIYKWYKGKALPSVDHLSALSRLLHVHMEELLVLKGESLINNLIPDTKDFREKRILAYVTRLKQIA